MDFTSKPQFQEHYELIDTHLNSYFKDATISVFHEIPTHDIHLDVYHIKPDNSKFEILITSGMSSIAMNVSDIPDDADSYKFAELMTLIPKGIDFGKMYPSQTPYDWIISMLKQAAKFPHFYDTWLGVGHTLQAEAELKPYSNDTAFCGCMVLPTMTFPDNFRKVYSPNGIINIYGLFPMYKQELEFKIKNGYNAFIQFLIKNNTPEIINFKRTNYC